MNLDLSKLTLNELRCWINSDNTPSSWKEMMREEYESRTTKRVKVLFT
jgi:hypothetical protein